MREEPGRQVYAWAFALIALMLLGAIPAAWAGPLAQPARQTIPPPPTPTPVIIIDEQVVEPEQPVTITVKVRNEREDPMVDCVLYLEPIEGVEYLVDGQFVEAPYEIPLGTIQPGEKVEVVIVVRLSEDAQPCVEYVVRIYLECEGEASVFRQIVLAAPCPALPEVGE